MSAQIDGVSVVKKSNVYFDGKCVSHTVLLAGGGKATVGVIFPSTLTFGTGAPETMDVVAGTCRVRLAGATEWTSYTAGQQFKVAGNTRFDIETIETLDYVCTFD